MAGNFLEQIKRQREASDQPRVPDAPKPTEQMNAEELEQAILETRRELLDAQHAELREREISRAQGSEPREPTPRSGLSEVLGNLQKHKRKTWR